MTDDILDRVERVLSGITEEPWEVIVEIYSSDFGDYEAAYIPGVVEEGASGYDVGPYGPLTVPVAEFIAASRTLIPELAEALRAARAENEQLRGELAATKGLLESTQQGHSETIRDFCTLRDALPREQVEQLLGGAPDDR